MEVVAAMALALPRAGQIELYRALAAEVNAPLTAADKHVHELGFLAGLIERHGVAWGEVKVIPRALYDARRLVDTPRSRTLVERYGSWIDVCQAADGLKADGRSDGPSVPWPARAAHKQPAPYTREEVLDAVRACAEGLGREPTTWIYAEWVRRKRTAARKAGKTLRLPYLRAVYKHVPADPTRPGVSRWQLVLEAAAIDETRKD